ncbi:MAG: radical SAM protein [Deltaproteobacteria bacterium]|nr:radical SAM protein [Deltaproteobacteria bacterium]
MVTGLISRAASALRDDVGGFAQVFSRGGSPGRSGGRALSIPTGLQTYRFQEHGGQTRLHLRVQDDGTGLLFRDVADVIHLTTTATEMIWMALEGWAPKRALAALQLRYRGPRGAFAADYARMEHVVQTMRSPTAAGESCQTCALDLPQVPLFSQRARAPHKVDLALTYACNNRCPHCYNDPSRFDLTALSTDDWKRILDRLAEVGVPHVIFTGGEATVYKGLPELIAHADAAGMMTGLNSNGRRLRDRAYVDGLRDAGLDHVQITLESHRAEVHDAMVGAAAFEQCVAGVRACLGTEGLHVLTNTTITRLNAGEIGETVEFLADLGLRTFAMNGMIYTGGGDANPDAIPQGDLPAILTHVRDTAIEQDLRFLWYTVTEYCEMNPVELEIGAKRCNAGEYSMCIEPDGAVLPCQSYYVSAGNVLRDSWEHIWRGELFRSFRDREEDPTWAKLPEKCHPCPDLPLCGGGCRIERESAAGVAPGGCQSCASGGVGSGITSGLAPGRGIRSTGISAASSCTCGTPDAAACGSDVHREALPSDGALVQLGVRS